MENEKQKIGRPSEYSDETVNKICDLLASGHSINAMCRDDDSLPSQATVFVWLSRHKEFQEKYARAREAWADAVFEEIFDIADETIHDTITKKNKDGSEYESPNNEWMARSRLRVDTRKWALARMSPRKYGDKVTQELTGADGKDLPQPFYNITIEGVEKK